MRGEFRMAIAIEKRLEVALQLLIERAKGRDSKRWSHLEEIPAAYDSTLFWSE